MEQAAGRASIEAGRRNKIVLDGKEELQRRFGKQAILAASWEFREDPNSYWVDVLIQPADGSEPMCFTEHLEEFPSDECITNIALVT